MLAEVRQRLTLNGSPNVMPFRWFKETPHAAYLVRQFFHQNLLERMSTPPFLTLVEKRWLAFQLLQALQQCHAAGICHGDIKMDNVLLTSSGWLFLADLANFKPAVSARASASASALAALACALALAAASLFAFSSALRFALAAASALTFATSSFRCLASASSLALACVASSFLLLVSVSHSRAISWSDCESPTSNCFCA